MEDHKMSLKHEVVTEGWNNLYFIQIFDFMRLNDIKRNVPIKWLYSDNLWQFGDNEMTKLDENSLS